MAKTESTSPTPHPEPTPAVDPRQMFRQRQSDSLASGLVAGGQSGYQYTLIRETDFRIPAEKEARVKKLTSYGWAPAPAGVYAPDAPDATVYQRPQSVADAEWVSDLVEVVKNPIWATLYHARGKHTLAPEVEEAMLAYHGLVASHAGRPTLAQLTDIVFDFTRPHPGGERKAPAWGKQAPTKGDK